MLPISLMKKYKSSTYQLKVGGRMTEDKMKHKISPERVGWLLSCEAKDNIDKGLEALRMLTSKEQRQARRYAKTLAASYRDRGAYETQTRLNSHPGAR